MINFKVSLKILGLLLLLEAVAMLTALPFSFFYRESSALPIALAALITMAAGGVIALVFSKTSTSIGRREGFIIVTFSWVLFSIFGTLPFIISGAIPSFTDAFFETMSGFTTTGASILTDIESIDKGLLYWRSLTQWLGGMGIIVLSLALLPILKIGNLQLFTAEVPGPTPDKLHPRVKETAKRLWGIYAGFTIIETALLMIGGMSFFDALCHSFTTMATGGYSTRNESIAAFPSPFIQIVIIVFMFIAGTNFTLAYFGIKLRFKKLLLDEEFRFYLSIVVIFTTIIAASLTIFHKTPLARAIIDAAFQVVSIITTTGFVTADYLYWGPLALTIIFMLMFTGGSAGSTGGGIKMVRLLILVKNSRMELRRLIHPNAVLPVKLNHKALPQGVILNVLAFVVFYFLLTGFSGIIIAMMGYDIETSFGAVAATLGNIGPGIGRVGPLHNFSHFPIFGKWFLSFLMLLGRLELFTVLILFSRTFYRR